MNLDNLLAEALGRKPKKPSDRAFELAKEASQVAARFGRLAEAKREASDGNR